MRLEYHPKTMNGRPIKIISGSDLAELRRLKDAGWKTEWAGEGKICLSGPAPLERSHEA